MAREHTRTYFLAKLASELEARGLAADLRDDPPALRVTAVLLTETVDCVPHLEGWSYRWSWGEVVGPADDPARAAERIARVLAD